ncbi:hypothetical protein KORDIASMS9_04342 [Kordia sp. SMS9]|uniref:hypothetical protein n=1 Tax=Kordia sp. SMS9 TaxID=2282170 RepID=UPI000E0DB8A4|nr:hypothetical protein [Kordia sp. SMS9]AXG72080.1 hypothetical protein KORDIASMS9_04342 [Kordia sp. SMS9]
MKKLLCILIGIVLASCSGTKSESRIKKRPKLPPIVSCAEDAKIFDQDVKYETNKLNTIEHLSYSTTYVRLYNQTDSLEKNEIRYKLAKTSERVALKVFPTIKLTDASRLLAENYKTILFSTNRVRKNVSDSKYFENLIIPNDQSNLQLFVYVVSGIRDKQFTTSFHFFVLNTTYNSLLYYDYVKTECDPRDETMFMKTLYYGMNKLKNSVK